MRKNDKKAAKKTAKKQEATKMALKTQAKKDALRGAGTRLYTAKACEAMDRAEAILDKAADYFSSCEVEYSGFSGFKMASEISTRLLEMKMMKAFVENEYAECINDKWISEYSDFLETVDAKVHTLSEMLYFQHKHDYCASISKETAGKILDDAFVLFASINKRLVYAHSNCVNAFHLEQLGFTTDEDAINYIVKTKNAIADKMQAVKNKAGIQFPALMKRYEEDCDAAADKNADDCALYGRLMTIGQCVVAAV